MWATSGAPRAWSRISGWRALRPRKRLFVKGDVEAGVQAALQQQLVAAQPQGLLYLGVIGFGGRDVGGALAGPAVEIAELTARDADVGDVDVAVYLPGHGTGLFHCTAAQCVGQAEKPCGRDRFVEPQRFVESERHRSSALPRMVSKFIVFSLFACEVTKNSGLPGGKRGGRSGRETKRGTAAAIPLFRILEISGLLLRNSLRRANTCAGAAGDAFVGVDNIGVITGRNRFGGTFSGA